MKKSILILLALMLLSCSKTNKEKANEKEDKKFDMYEMSEMAMLMEQFYVNNYQLKQKINNGAHLGEFPEQFLAIHTAAMTKKQERDSFFIANANKYIAAHKMIYSHPQKAKAYFNSSIDVCVTCHQEKCTGPIQRIKKLYIK